MSNKGPLQLLIRPPSTSAKLVSLGVALGGLTAFRWSIDSVSDPELFGLYFLIILIVSVAFGWRWALVSVAVVFLIVREPFNEPALPHFAAPMHYLTLALFLTSSFIAASFGAVLRATVQEAESKARSVDTFNHELQHRSKNMSSLVLALVARAAKADDSAEAFDTLEGRLRALFASNDLLQFGNTPSCNVEELLRHVLRPFQSRPFNFDGPPCMIDKSAAVPLAMAVHELATNAIKYGALSVNTGKVELRWQSDPDGHVAIDWREAGGPEVAPPQTKGFGSRLLQANGGLIEVEHNYLPNGVQCRFQVKAGTRDDRSYS